MEFRIEQPSRLSTGREQAFKPLYLILGSARLVVAWIELFWRHCL